MQQSVQKRARQQLSCTACRHGKLRCNRQQPCDQCLKRSKASSCQYLAPPEKKRKARNTKDRIAHLEGLVVQLMSHNTSGNSSSPGSLNESDSTSASVRTRDSSSSSPTVSADTRNKNRLHQQSNGAASVTAGQLTVANGETHYHGAAHWEAILEDIADIRADLDDEEEEEQPEDVPSDKHTPLLVLGAPSPVTREMLLNSIPSKPEVDRMIWNWFQSPDPSLPIIHKPTFIQEYEQFWRDPTSTPTMWLAILYCIMCLGSRLSTLKIQMKNSNTNFPEDTVSLRYQELASCAIALADYTKPKKYTAEALMMYAGCEYMKQDDSQVRLWLFMAVVLRTALRMGYHRDSDHYPSITPFEGEMRRRLWYNAYTFDILTSFQLGLPGIVLSLECDTKRPSNLLDDDFGPDTTVLPPSRPLSEISPVTFTIVKSKLSMVFARAAGISHAVREPSYTEVMEIDEQLTQVYNDFPPAMQFTSMTQSLADSPSLIFNRFKIELLYRKTRCVLHRRYLTEKLSDPRFEQSRKICVDAAMQLLRHHGSIYEASQGSGPLSSTRWFMSSLNAHDFLLGAMVLCLELNLLEKCPMKSDAPGKPSAAKVEEIKALLRRSYDIYKLPVRHYAHTAKALKVMELILDKSHGLQDAAAEAGREGDVAGVAPSSLDANLAQPLEFLSIDQTTAAPMVPSIDMGEMAPIGDMFNQGIDWQTWDNYINQGTGRFNFDVSLAGLDPNLFGTMSDGFDDGLSTMNENNWAFSSG